MNTNRKSKRRRRSSVSRSGRLVGQPLDRRLHVETLEDRRMLAVITVTSVADNAFPDGGITLREAILAANTNAAVGDAPAGDAGADTIRFAAALSGQTIDLGGEMEITEALTIDATALAANVTIDANNASRIFNITATSGDFTLAGLTLTGGRTTGFNAVGDTTFSGGAVRSVTTGSLTLDQSTVSGNSTADFGAYGGGIFSSGAVTLTSSTVSGNGADGGGGIFSSGDVTLTSSTVTGNSTTGDFANGGGIYSSGDVTLTNSTVSGNSTAGETADGGGISSRGAITLTSSTVSENSTTGEFANGGGIFSLGAVTLTSSTVSGNSTTGRFAAQGGGIFSSGDVTLTSTTISGNSTRGEGADGGGIFSYGTTLFTSSTITENSTMGESAYGGGVYSYGDVTLTNSTVSGNSTTGKSADGGGIFSFAAVSLTGSTVTANHATFSNATGGGIWNSDNTLTITNSIVAGNTAGDGSPDIDPGTGIFDVDFSLLGTAVTPDPGGSGNLFNDTPLLGPLAEDSGPTQTHALLAGSLAIDAGDPNFTSPPEFDQRGAPFARGVGLRVDIGAYERQTLASSFFVVTTSTDELDYNNADVSLREAINSANGSIGPNTITFDAALSGDTIELGGIEMGITEALTIDATALAQNVTIDANESSRIFKITATTGNFTLAGLTLTGGRTNRDKANFSDTTFSGGAVRSLTTGHLTVDQSTISGNSTEGVGAQGGGIFSSGDVTLTSSTLTGNSTTGYGAQGGGIFSSGTITLTSSTVSRNGTAGSSADGGGIFSSGNLTLKSSTVSGNSTAGTQASGGGIFSISGDVSLTSSTVSGNSTTGNYAPGGGVYSSGDVLLTNSTISGNSTTGSSSDGGGLRSSGDVTLTHSTVTANYAFHASADGGGVWNSNGTMTIANSIVAGNGAGGSGPDVEPGSGSFAADFSLLGTAVTPDVGGSGNFFNNNPQLGPLANNGGPTETHALLTGSSAINAGDPSFTSPPNFDQRGPGAPGFVRVFGGRIDIGAFETGTTVSPLEGDYDNDGFVGQADLDLVLLNWGKTSPPVPAGWVNQVPAGLIGQAALDGALLHWGDGTPPIATLKTPVAQADLIDAVMAVELFRSRPVAGVPVIDDEPAFVETLADHVFAAEAIAPASVLADENEILDTNSSNVEEAETPRLADELLERVFG